MQLVESRPSDLPVRFLVQVAQCHRVGEKLIELCGHFQPYRLLQFKRQKLVDGSVRLNLSSPLVNGRLFADFSASLAVGHEFSLLQVHPFKTVEHSLEDMCILRARDMTRTRYF